MNLQLPKIEKEVLFVEARQGVSKDSQKEYKIVVLSDGLQSQVFNYDGDIALFKQFERGDQITAEFEVDIFKKNFNVKLLGLLN